MIQLHQFRRKTRTPHRLLASQSGTGPTGTPEVGEKYAAQVATRLESAARMSKDERVQARIATAPAVYALAHSSSDIARHGQLLEPLCRTGEVRVLATPGRVPGTWNLDLASLDQPRLLALFTGILVHEAIDVERAVLATWDDGAALQALVVRGRRMPDVVALQESLEWSLSQGLFAPPVRDATVTFDQSASDLYTACEVTAPDRPGLLHAIAVAIAAAGADIHAASVETIDGVARDRFDLSDEQHQKLQPIIAGVIEQALRSGFSGR